MNDHPFEYTSHNGTVFYAERCDFRGGVTVTYKPVYPFPFAEDVAEMIGYHATNIHPKLNGFQGYDCIKWIRPQAMK